MAERVFRAAALDYNGTFLNDPLTFRRAVRWAFRARKLTPPSDEDFFRNFGDNPFAFYAARGLVVTPDEMQELLNRYFAIHAHSKPMPYVRGVLRMLGRHGIPRGLITLLRSDVFVEEQERHRLHTQFEFFASGLSSKEEALHSFCEFAQCDPSQVVFVTDSGTDIDEAKRVGCATVGFTEGYTGESVLQHGPDFAMSDWRQFLMLCAFEQMR